MVLVDLIKALSFEEANHIGIIGSQLALDLRHGAERFVDVIQLVAYLSDAKIDLLFAKLGIKLCHSVEVS